jgi:hypothetical protein
MSFGLKAKTRIRKEHLKSDERHKLWGGRERERA